MSLRSRVRDDFPRGWWHSTSWWLSGLADLGLWCVACVFTLGLSRRAYRVVIVRDDPSRLARVDAEKFAAGALVNSAGLFGCGQALLAGEFDGAASSVVAVWIGLCAINVAVAITVLVVLARSRLRARVAWSMIDFVEDHLPPAHRPPQTRTEYEASRLADTLIDDGQDARA